MDRAHHRLAFVVALATTSLGCLSLGPMPSTLGISAVPAERPDVALQAGLVPGFRLSGATTATQRGSPSTEVAAVVEPDRWVGVPGLLLGARSVSGSKGDGYFEPIVGYRRQLRDDRRLALLVAGSFGKAGRTAEGATYSATRGGGDLGLDLRANDENRYAEIHAFAGASLSAISAEGTYCVDADRRYGVDCSKDAANPSPTVRGKVGGVYPALTGGLAIDFARHLAGHFHGGRVALHAAYGQMPTVVGGVEGDRRGYSSGGITLTLGFGGP